MTGRSILIGGGCAGAMSECSDAGRRGGRAARRRAETVARLERHIAPWRNRSACRRPSLSGSPTSSAPRAGAPVCSISSSSAYVGHQRDLFTHGLRATRDADAADLVQDTFLRLVAELRVGRSPDERAPVALSRPDEPDRLPRRSCLRRRPLPCRPAQVGRDVPAAGDHGYGRRDTPGSGTAQIVALDARELRSANGGARRQFHRHRSGRGSSTVRRRPRRAPGHPHRWRRSC